MATYVLIHGAYQGSWLWKPVATRRRAAGHAVYAPRLDGCAERHHLQKRTKVALLSGSRQPGTNWTQGTIRC